MSNPLAVRARDVLFAHWPVDPSTLRPHVPEPLSIATFEGTAWLGVVALELTGVRAGPLPAGLRPFAQVNLRTYARFDGDLGVHFLSLDAGNPLAAGVARRVWGLPFHAARSRVDRRARSPGTADDGTETVILRSERRAGRARFDARYTPRGDPTPVESGTLAHSLIERHRFFVERADGRITVGEIERDPWQVSEVDATVRTNTLADALGVDCDPTGAHTHYSPRFASSTGRPTVVKS